MSSSSQVPPEAPAQAPPPQTDPEREALLTRFNNLLGPSSFHAGWSSLLNLSPQFFSASLNLASVPLTKSHLSPKNQSLIALAVDSAATHLYAPGIRSNIVSALSRGASLEEVLEVIELSSTLGIHACNIGVPLLVEVLRETKDPQYEDLVSPGIQLGGATAGGSGTANTTDRVDGEGNGKFDPKREALKEEFTRKRGYWHTFWEDFLRLDPEFFEAYLGFSGLPWTKEWNGKREGVLEPKVCLHLIIHATLFLLAYKTPTIFAASDTNFGASDSPNYLYKRRLLTREMYGR